MDNKGDEVLFANVGEGLKTENYLGDWNVIETLLRTKINDFVTAYPKAKTPDARIEAMRKVATEVATILLGENKDYPGQRRWNEPGGIDVFCAHWLGSNETDPKKRMIHSVVKLLNEVIELSEYAGEEGVLEEQWVDQFSGLVSGYVGIFLGMDPAAQAATSITDEENGDFDVEEPKEETQSERASNPYERSETE